MRAFFTRCVLPAAALLFLFQPSRAQHYIPGGPPDSLYKGAYASTSNPLGCSCHNGPAGAFRATYPGWAASRHAKAFDSVAVIQNNPACISCHVTGWDTTQANGGFDDFFRAMPQDSVGMVRMRNVQCESCHKPYHSPQKTYDISMTAEKCADCHNSAFTPSYDDWRQSLHAVSKYTRTGRFTLTATNPNCAGCHTAEGFKQWSKQTGIAPNVVVGDTATTVSLTCAGCHDPHDVTNHAQLRLPVTELCTKCHNPEYNPDSAAVGEAVHHSTAYMFEGKGGFHYPGFMYPSSAHKFVVTNKCVTCHVHRREGTQNPFMPTFTGHTFFPSKLACGVQGCHATTIDTTMADSVVFNYKNVQTTCDSLASVLAGKLGSASPADSAGLAFKQAKFNLDFYQADGSQGVHNTAYAVALLTSAIANFTPTGVEELDAPVPERYELAQNYPNPFNPATIITFALPVRSHVRVLVYDIVGHVVTTLVDDEMGAGRYRVQWNGEDAAGARVASGIYLYKMEAGSATFVRKAILLK